MNKLVNIGVEKSEVDSESSVNYKKAIESVQRTVTLIGKYKKQKK